MKNKNGFTLIELLAVIVILAIIALIATPTVLNAIADAKTRASKESARAFVKAAELYCAQQLIAATPATITTIQTSGTETASIKNIPTVGAKGTQPSAVASFTLTDCVVNGAATVTITGYTPYVVSDLKANN